MKKLFFFLLLTLFYTACSPTKKTISKVDNGVTSPNNLEYYLNRMAGVQVEGTGESATAHVSIGGNEPIFIVNGNEVGKSLASAATVVRNKKIKSVKLLRPLEAESLYGLRSCDGIIIIKTE